MTTDAFTEAARAEAERRNPSNAPKGLTRASNAISRRDFRDGAEWARTHFAENGYGPMTTEKVREWTGAWPAEQRRALANTIPTAEVIRDAVTFPRDRLGEPLDISGERFDAWLSQVRRDAAREALDGLAVTYRDVSTLGILQYRDTHYPEETP